MLALARNLFLVLAFSVVLAPAAQAQAIFGAAEADDDDVTLLLLGGAWAPGGLGWKPFGSVVGYNLRFPGGLNTTISRNVILPTVGLVHAQEMQSVQFGVGYAFSDDDSGVPLLVPAQSGEGFVTSFGWDYWGTGTRAAQVLASYNVGTKFLWTRGRYSVPIAASPLWFGGEVAMLGGGNPAAYLAQFGPTLEWRFNPQFRLGGAAGLKTGISNASGSAVYGRIEFLWLPMAR